MTEEWRVTARVVRRLGFGATGAEVDAAVAAGLPAWLGAALPDEGTQGVVGVDPGVAATPPPSLTQPAKLAKGADKEARKRHNGAVRAGVESVAAWWLRRMASAQRPTREKITLGWHGIFATSARKVRSGPLMLAQNQTLRRLGLGDFDALAKAMLADPAMIEWLDGDRSTAKAPNENLAREFMELFALGRDGGYTEQDVREGARALTGWRIRADGTAYVDPKRADTGTKTVLGRTGRLDANGFCDAVLAAPASPRFVATRWWRYLAAPEPPSEQTLARLVAAYGTGRDVRALIRAIVTDPEFAGADGSLVVTPVEWYVGALRALRCPLDDAALKRALKNLTALGQVPLAPPSVGGWPAGQAWLSTATARTRYDAAGELVKTARLDAITAVAPERRIDAVAYLLGLPGFSQRTVRALTPHLGTPPMLVRLGLVSPEYLVN